jgi:hypothetical protein
VCRAQKFAVDAAVARAGVRESAGSICSIDPPAFGNAAREEVSRKVARAFDAIFYDAKPRLIPVLNHAKVQRELQKWDQYQQKLELVEVRATFLPDEVHLV